MESRLLSCLVCPCSGGSLQWRPQTRELWCAVSRLSYPVRDGIAIMCVDEARALSDQEYDSWQKEQ